MPVLAKETDSLARQSMLMQRLAHLQVPSPLLAAFPPTTKHLREPPVTQVRFCDMPKRSGLLTANQYFSRICCLSLCCILDYRLAVLWKVSKITRWALAFEAAAHRG